MLLLIKEMWQYFNQKGQRSVLVKADLRLNVNRRTAYSTAFTMSSTTFFASPNTIIVLSM